MAQLPDLPALEGGAAASFHCHQARRQLAEKCHNLISPQLLAQNRPPRSVSAMGLKHSLRQVEPDRDNLRHDRSPLWILAYPPSHIDAFGGRSHHQSRWRFRARRSDCQVVKLEVRVAVLDGVIALGISVTEAEGQVCPGTVAARPTGGLLGVAVPRQPIDLQLCCGIFAPRGIFENAVICCTWPSRWWGCCAYRIG